MNNRMDFCKYFGVKNKTLDDYGAVNISLHSDIPLFIDPLLIFNSNKPEYQELHKSIIKYFDFLIEMKTEKGYSFDRMKDLLNFKEIKNTWFGYSKSGNRGSALGVSYSKFLYDNLKTIESDTNICK